MEFINCIIKCSIISEDKVQISLSNTLSTFLDKLDSKFALKFEVH